MRPIVVFALALSAGLAGCDLVKSPDDRDDSHHRYSYCDSTGCYSCDSSGCNNVGQNGGRCNSDWDCAPGWDCDSGTCKKTSFCQNGASCPTGQTCDSRSTCVGGTSGAPTCTQDIDCANGFCDTRSHVCVTTNACGPGGSCGAGWTCDSRNICIPMPCSATQTCQTGCYCDSGNCIESAVCNSDQDCASLSMTCDTASHTCIPSQTTTPPPPPGCTTDAGCAAGESCCNGECKVIQSVPPADSCNLGQCGIGGLCIYDARNVGLCHFPCNDDSGCGTGDYCFGGICEKNPTPQQQCVFNTDCPADNTCINATCHPNCTDTCPNPHDFCDQGICQPDWRRVSECSLDTDCSYALDQCVDGTCATRCMQDADCSGCPHGPTCIMGYCGQG